MTVAVSRPAKTMMTIEMAIMAVDLSEPNRHKSNMASPAITSAMEIATATTVIKNLLL